MNEEKQLHTLRHMLGINNPSKEKPISYRNYAAVMPGDKHFIELEQLGYIEKYHSSGRETDYDWYRRTELGTEKAIASFKTIQDSAGKRRYSRYLHLREVLPSLTFRDFLIDPEYKQIRNGNVE